MSKALKFYNQAPAHQLKFDLIKKECLGTISIVVWKINISWIFLKRNAKTLITMTYATETVQIITSSSKIIHPFHS